MSISYPIADYHIIEDMENFVKESRSFRQGNRIYPALLPACHSEYRHGAGRAVQTERN